MITDFDNDEVVVNGRKVLVVYLDIFGVQSYNYQLDIIRNILPELNKKGANILFLNNPEQSAEQLTDQSCLEKMKARICYQKEFGTYNYTEYMQFLGDEMDSETFDKEHNRIITWI